MCSQKFNMTCGYCQNNCFDKWKNYYDILPGVGLGTDEIKGYLFGTFGVVGLTVGLTLLPIIRTSRCLNIYTIFPLEPQLLGIIMLMIFG